MNFCIDPGSRVAGAALFEGKELVAAWLSEGTRWEETADNIFKTLTETVNIEAIQTVIIERMQIYDSTPLAHANDCITLSLMAGRVTGMLPGCDVVAYVPKAWKGGAPKKIMTERIKSLMSEVEHSRVVPCKKKSLMHNVYDAVGIGKRHAFGARYLGH